MDPYPEEEDVEYLGEVEEEEEEPSYTTRPLFLLASGQPDALRSKKICHATFH